MKTASSPDPQNAQPSASTPAAKPDAQYVTVYTFYVYDHDAGKPVIYPRMATPAAVAKMRGKLNEDSAWVVDASSLDVEGFYSESNGKPRR